MGRLAKPEYPWVDDGAEKKDVLDAEPGTLLFDPEMGEGWAR